MIERLIHRLSLRPWAVVMTVLGLTLIAGLSCFDLNSGAMRFRIDPATERLLPAKGPDRAVFERARELFGDSDGVLVAVGFDDAYTADSISTIERLSQAFDALDGVHNVFSLATAPNPTAVGEDLDVSSFAEQARADPARIAGFAAAVEANPLYRGLLIARDGRTAAFLLVLEEAAVEDFADQGLTERVRAVAAQLAPAAPVQVTGTPVLRAATTQALENGLKFTIPAVFLIIGLLLLCAFQSLRATLAALATIVIALVWTLATSVWLRIPFNLVTGIVPPLVVTIGLSSTIHLLGAYFYNPSDAARAPGKTGWRSLLKVAAEAAHTLWAGRGAALSGPEHTRWVMNRILTGLSLSAATTIVGFLALTINPLPAIKQFAILSSLGVVYTAVLTLVFLPALLALIGSTRRPETPGERGFRKLATMMAAFAVRRRVLIIGIALVLVPLEVYYATQIRTGTDFVQSFNAESTVRRDFEAINTAFNGANLLEILIETHVNEALTDPDLVRRLDALAEWLRAQPEVGGVASYVDHLKLINQGFNGNDPAFFAVPKTDEEVKQLFAFGGSDELKRVVDLRYRSALMSVRINVDGSIATGDLMTRIEAQLAQLPAPLNAQITGSSAIATRTVNQIAQGHLESIALATLAIWLMLSVLFTSWRAGLLATLPNLIPVAVYFGALGALGISLNPTTSLVACIVLGIAVNDTVHFLARFNSDARTLADESKALTTAMSAVLRPITLATIALCLGFLVFTGSEIRSQAQFGALAAFTLAMAWLADMTLTPALGSRLRIVTLWDLLRLDLGQSPQHTIPLFHGLSARQARVFALLSKLESHPSGHRVITEGDVASDMFVIVDGNVEVSIERGGEKKTLSTMSRGAVMGETGYFGQKRTANVDAKSPVRLLRFNAQDLENLRGRYPKIAATLYRNLNRVQAERIARMTTMIQ